MAIEAVFEQMERTPAARGAYTIQQRAWYAVSAVAAAVLIAGFWNAPLVDGFGRDVAGRTVGDPDALSTTFAQNGFAFGFFFAAVAGVAATFTACNCVVFAILPGLAASGPRASSRRSALTILGIFTIGVVVVGAIYGMFIGSLGPAGIEAFNTREIRRSVAATVFSTLGTMMLLWGAIEMEFLDRLTRRISPATRALVSQTATKAGLLGVMVGAFLIGRPFPVMRDFLIYAAASNSPLYGAAVMVVVGLGQIALMVLLFIAVVYGAGAHLSRWISARPDRAALMSGLSLLAGGSFFVFYWGLAFAYGIGRWGFRLGWYS